MRVDLLWRKFKFCDFGENFRVFSVGFVYQVVFNLVNGFLGVGQMFNLFYSISGYVDFGFVQCSFVFVLEVDLSMFVGYRIIVLKMGESFGFGWFEQIDEFEVDVMFVGFQVVVECFGGFVYFRGGEWIKRVVERVVYFV